jgi:hypothetical protein
VAAAERFHSSLPTGQKAKELFQRAHFNDESLRPHACTALARLILPGFHHVQVPDGRMFIFVPFAHVLVFKRLLLVRVLSLLVMPLAHLVALPLVASVDFVDMLAGHSAITLLTRMWRMGRATIKGRPAACRASGFAPRSLMRHRGISAAALSLMGFTHALP